MAHARARAPARAAGGARVRRTRNAAWVYLTLRCTINSKDPSSLRQVLAENHPEERLGMPVKPYRVLARNDVEEAAAGLSSSEPDSTADAALKRRGIWVDLFEHRVFDLVRSDAVIGCWMTSIILKHLLMAAGAIERMVCGSPDRPFPVDALLAAGIAVFMPMGVLSAGNSLRRFVKRDPLRRMEEPLLCEDCVWPPEKQPKNVRARAQE